MGPDRYLKFFIVYFNIVTNSIKKLWWDTLSVARMSH